MTLNWQNYKKYETIGLSFLLYGIVLLYTYQYFLIADKYEPWTTDEFYYHTEARGIAESNLFQTPASIDGNTSFIGDFGFHGISYAIKDGFLAKLFFHTSDPPLVLINYLTCIALIGLILLFKRFSFDVRLKIALVVASHYVLFSYTLSYMQETIHYFFAVLALELLYIAYQTPSNSKSKHLLYYLALVIIAITFRYGWFIWALALLPFATDFKNFIKWGIVGFVLLVFAVLTSRYIAAPFPYNQIVADQIFMNESFSILNSLEIIWNRFTENSKVFFTPTVSLTTTCMRYLLVFLLLVSAWYSVKKQNRFTIACTIVAWAYFIAALAFYHVYWSYDERGLAVLTPVFAFSLIGNSNSFLFYPIIAVQLFFLPSTITSTKERNDRAIAVNASSMDRESKEASYAKIAELIGDEKRVVIATDVGVVVHGTTNYFTKFPLTTQKGYPIHYRLNMLGYDLKGTNQPDYLLNLHFDPAANPNQLIYSDEWMYLYNLSK